ncbi:DUF3667 domain-containing protein [Hymenobacter yonginensis]|uniref:DUF3667 domain-containing protein n=1 Tax=Hymenobacter yonginensis TaxID=748197 RepID=A0ABY7PIW7_9BACT|nr:DUF3667 domain-containing protein [Hymenobacter yonginensis]WBO82856.1 DUF3667 domain-containing protein [Hymenobacter yonginensis]
MSSISLPSAPVAAHLPLPSEAAHTAAHTCLNCGHPVPDRFCGRCGQDAHHTHRLTMADMPHDVLHSIWHVDKGILYTLRTMIRRPGPTIREYLAGKRVDHFRPLALLFMITGLYALLSSVLHIQMLPPRDPTMPEAVWKMQQASTGFLMKYMSWCYVAMVPVWALFARWFLRRGGYNYAECLIIAAFVTAIINFFALLYLPVTYTYSDTPQIGMASVLFMLPVVAYSTWAYGSLLKHTTLSLARRLWCGFMTYMLGYIVCVLVIVITTYAINWSTFKEAMKQQMEQQRLQQARVGKPAAALLR